MIYSIKNYRAKMALRITAALITGFTGGYAVALLVMAFTTNTPINSTMLIILVILSGLNLIGILANSIVTYREIIDGPPRPPYREEEGQPEGSK